MKFHSEDINYLIMQWLFTTFKNKYRPYVFSRKIKRKLQFFFLLLQYNNVYISLSLSLSPEWLLAHPCHSEFWLPLCLNLGHDDGWHVSWDSECMFLLEDYQSDSHQFRNIILCSKFCPWSHKYVLSNFWPPPQKIPGC